MNKRNHTLGQPVFSVGLILERTASIYQLLVGVRFVDIDSTNSATSARRKTAGKVLTMFDQWLDSLLETLNQEGFSLIDFELTVDEWREKFYNGENATLVANELLKSIGWIE